MGWPEYQKEYGQSYSVLVDVQIVHLNYLLSRAPPLTMEDIVRIMEGMEPVGG
ncbi:MAG: hypothetical protein QW220_01830 [Candidatus Bathyarchaeia archaeon]